MRNFSCVLACFTFFLIPLCAKGGNESDAQAATAIQKPLEPSPLDLFNFEQGYVFESDLNHGGSFGRQDEIQTEFEYGHRVRLSGNLFLHLGLSYDRYDFGSTSAPVPNHLQAFAGVIGVDYMHGKDVGAFFQVRPGFYTQDDIGISSFDAPISVGRIFVVKEDKFYLLLGAYASFLRGGLPVLPIAGVIWIPSDNVRLMGVLPDPKLIYSPTKKLDLWIGGELVGGSYRTDRNPDIQPGKLDGTQVNFSDYRAGVGLTYQASNSISLTLAGGCSIQREFDFARAGETYRTDPSPYVRIQMSAAF